MEGPGTDWVKRRSVSHDIPQARRLLSGSGGAWGRAQTAVLALFLVLAYLYSFAVQPGYGPDEPRHFAYVRRLVEKRELPFRSATQEADGAHSLHPPLYYLLVSPVYAVSAGLGEMAAYRALKSVSPLLLAGALILFLQTLVRLFPDRPELTTGALAIVAFLPEFQLEAAVVNNDALAVLLGAALLHQTTLAAASAPSSRRAVFIGLIAAAFVNTKATGWTLSPLIVAATAVRAMSGEPDRKGLWRDLAISLGILLATGTWWYLLNLQRYGQPVPLDFGPGDVLKPLDSEGHPLQPLDVYARGYVVHYGGRAVVGLFQSFWSQIDWIREDFRSAIWGGLLFLALGGVVGNAMGAARGLPALIRGERPSWGTSLPGLGFALVLLHTWYVATFMHQGFYQGGRYLMPGVYGAGIGLTAGWELILGSKPRVFPVFWSVVLIGFLALNVHCLTEIVFYLNPRYVRH